MLDEFPSLTHDGSNVQAVTEQRVPQTLVSERGHVQLSQQHLVCSAGGFLFGNTTEKGSALPCSEATSGILSHHFRTNPKLTFGVGYLTRPRPPPSLRTLRYLLFYFQENIANLVFNSNDGHMCDTHANHFTFPVPFNFLSELRPGGGNVHRHSWEGKRCWRTGNYSLFESGCITARRGLTR